MVTSLRRVSIVYRLKSIILWLPQLRVITSRLNRAFDKSDRQVLGKNSSALYAG
jgi:hypothetical protein